MADKLPKDITPGTPNDNSVVHASDADVSDLSRSHAERDISRLQGAAPIYDATKTYNVSDLVTETNITYRNITAIAVPEVFNPVKWKDIDGDTSPLTTKGDLFTFDTADARLGVGTNGQVLEADSLEATGLKWATPSTGGTLKSLIESYIPYSTQTVIFIGLNDQNEGHLINSANWVTGLNRNFTVVDGNDNRLRYDGVDDIEVVIDYNASVQSTATNGNVHLLIQLNSTSTNDPASDIAKSIAGESSIASFPPFRNISGSILLTLSQNDEINLAVQSSLSQDTVVVNQTYIRIVEINKV